MNYKLHQYVRTVITMIALY